MGPIICPEKPVRNYHYSLRVNSEERSSLIVRGGSLLSRLVGPDLRPATSGSHFTALEYSECQIVFLDFVYAFNCFSHKYNIRQKL